MRRRVVAALAAAVVVSSVAAPSLATEDGSCDLRPEVVDCTGSGSGGGGGSGSSSTTTTIAPSYVWGAWQPNGSCVGTNPRYIRYLLWETGGLVDPAELTGPPPDGSLLGDSYVYETVCVRLTIQADDVWAELVTDVEALPEPVPATSPSATGVTGLETWFWYDGATQVGPVGVSWTDGTTGETFELEGVAWVGTIGWNTADDRVLRVSAFTYAEGADIGGSESEPAGTHTYEQTSESAGLGDGYPLTMTLTWVGEWRWRVAGGPWNAWRPMASTVDVVATRLYPVAQVIGELQPTG